MPPSLPLDPQGRLDADIPCIVCGYNLRASDPAGDCPECGKPVEQSVRGDLRYADASWLARVHFGLILLLIMCLAGFISENVARMIMGAVHTGSSPPNRWIQVTWMAYSFAVELISLIAWLKITAFEPRSPHPESGLSSRLITRGCAILSFSLVMLSAVFGEFTTSAMLTLIASKFIVVIKVIAAGLYARTLALRIPNAPLAQQARFLAWSLGVTLIMLLCLFLVLVGTTNPSPVSPPLTSPYLSPTSNLYIEPVIAFLLLLLAALVLSVRMLLMANRLRMALRDILHSLVP